MSLNLNKQIMGDSNEYFIFTIVQALVVGLC